MDFAEIGRKLEQASRFADLALHGVAPEKGEWELSTRRPPKARISVVVDPGRESVALSQELRLPAVDAPGAADADDAVNDLVSNVVLGISPMFEIDAQADRHRATLRMPIYADGFTVQEVMRAIAALRRADDAIATAMKRYAEVMARSGEISTLIADAASRLPDPNTTKRQLADLEREFAALTGESAPAAPPPPPPQRRCPTCGREVPENHKFCSFDGTRVD
jgi:hypothetical protein